MSAATLRARIAPFWPALAAVGLVAVAVVPRVLWLELRPVIHDESLFSYYSFIYERRGHYGHIPMLHGPTLILSLGTLFGWIGDSIVVARGFIVVCSLVALSLALTLTPRTYRGWFAALLFSSPILLYYSRFARNEMLFNVVLMLGMVGIVRALAHPTARGRAAWAVLGAGAAVALMAVKENSLFVYAAAATFAVIWALERAWRRRRRGTSDAAGRSALPRRRGLVAAGWTGGVLLGLLVSALLYGVTLTQPERESSARAVLGDQSERVAAVARGSESLEGFARVSFVSRLAAKSWLNAKASWDYWRGQHEQHRIKGALHYHVPILLLYELPILLLLYAGLAWDAARGRRRALAYAAGYAAWLVFWGLWWVADWAGPPAAIARVEKFLHIGANGSMMVLGLMFTPMLVWSVLCLQERRLLAGWLGWWAACSLFQYSSAGEKVPWLAVHILLPTYLMLPWVWEPLLARFGRRAHAVAVAVVLVVLAIALRNDYYLMGERTADPRERLVYNHTTPWFDEYVRNRLALWEEAAAPLPSRNRKVVLVGATGWPGVWYFRKNGYQLLGKDKPPETLAEDVDLVIGDKAAMDALAERSQADWASAAGSLRDHWWAPWPDERDWQVWRGTRQPGRNETPRGFFALLASSTAKLWRYYWFRETWTDPGGFPIVALERRCARR